MKNYRPIVFILLFIGALILIKFLFFPSPQTGSKGPKGKNGPQGPVMVDGFVTSEQPIDNTFFTNGTVLPNEKASIQSEIPGMLTSLNYEEGRLVSKGQILATINDAEWKAQLKKLDAQLELATQKKNRYEKLLASGGVSKEEFETATAEVSSLNAEADIVRAQLAKAQIRAPFSGVLGFRKVSPGSYVSTGTIIGEMVQVSPVKIEFTVPEKYARTFSTNSRITFTINGDAKSYEAKVYAMEPEVDASTRTVAFHALYTNKNNELTPGAFARITIFPEKKSTGILIPTQSVIPVLKGKKVFVVRGGKAVSQPIETGLRTDTHVQVITGLQVGDTVITTGIMSINDGTPVKLIVPAIKK